MKAPRARVSAVSAVSQAGQGAARLASVQVRRVGALRCELGGEPIAHPDEISVEEPLEIRVAGETLAVTMRTPGTITSWRRDFSSPKG